MNSRTAKIVCRFILGFVLIITAVPKLGLAPLSAQVLGSSGGGIFLTRAEEKDVPGTGKKIWVPTNDKISFAWSDTPFAIHFPWQMETEILFIADYMGAPKHRQVAAKDYVLKTFLKGFSYQDGPAKGADTLNVLAYGLYRADQQKVYSADRDGDSVGPYRYAHADEPGLSLRNLEFASNEDVTPLRLGGRSVAGDAPVALWIVVDPRYRNESIGGSDDPTKSYYSKSLNAGLRHWPGFGEKSVGRIVVKLDVLEGEPAKMSDGPLADSPTNKKQRQALAAEYEFTVRQNGWSLKDGKATNTGDWGQKINPENDTNEDWRLQDTGTSVTATTLTSTHRLNGRRLDNPDKGLTMATDVSLRVDLPRILWDHEPSDVTSTVSVVRKTSTAYDAPSLRWPHGLIRNGGPAFGASPLTLGIYGYSQDAGLSKNPPLVAWYDLYGFNPALNHVVPVAIGPMRGAATILTAKSPRLDGTLPSSWTADEKISSHNLLALDVRFFPGKGGIAPNQVPAKHFDIPATRLSDLESNLAGQTSAAAPSPPAESPSDDYYEWLAEFTTKTLPEVEQQVSEIKAELMGLAAYEESCVQEFMTLLFYDQQAYRGLSEDKDLLDHLSDQLLLQRDETLLPAVTKQALQGLRQKRDEVRQKKAAVRPAQDEAIAEALKLMKQTIETVEVKGIGYNALHPEHKQTIAHLKDRYDLLKLELYDAAQLYEGDEFERLMAEVGFGSVKDQELRLLMKAKAAHARARAYERRLWVLAGSPTGLKPDSESEMRVKDAKAEAYESILAVLKLNPENREARVLRKALEVSFLEAITAKLESEKQASLLAFKRFFEERGFSVENDSEWWTGFLESPYVWLGMGPVSSILGWAKALETESATDIQQTAIAKNHVALLAIRKLVRNGMSLPQIRTITPAQMELGMSVNTKKQYRLKPDQVQRLCRDIRETFIELGDLQALADGNREAFGRLHPKAYYNLIHPEKSRVEFWSDFFFSPLSLFGWFSPWAITKVEGQWQYFRLSATAEHLALLDDLNEVQRGAEWFNKVLRLERLGQRLAKLPGSGVLARLLAQDAAYVGTLSARMQFINGGARAGARLGSTFLLYGGLFLAADASNIPALKIFCDILGTLGTGDLTRGFLSHAGVSIRRAEEKLGELAAVIAKKKRELSEYAALIAELEKIRQKAVRAGQAQRGGLDSDTLKQIEALIAAHEKTSTAKAGSIKIAPGILPDKDAAITFRVAAEALKRGDLKQAESALKGVRGIQAAMTAEAEAIEKKLAAAREVLQTRGEPPPFQQDPRRFRAIMENDRPEEFTLGKGLNPEHPVAAFILQGDNAVRMGDFEAAETIYRAGKKLGEGTPYEALVNDRLDLMLCGRDYLKKLQLTRANAAPSNCSEPIRETDQQLADKLNGLTSEMRPFAGGMNPIYQVRDPSGKVFIFKRIDGEEEIYSEVVSTTLFNYLGGKAPTARHVRKINVPVYDKKTGQFLRTEEADGIVYNFVEGKEVGELTEPEILAIKKDLASLRAFRLWLCDTDGHMRNFKFTPSGEPIPIDFGFAHLRNKLDLPQLSGAVSPANQKQLMIEAMQFSKHMRQARNASLVNATTGQQALYSWIDRVDGMLSYDDMAPLVEKIEALCKDKAKLEQVIKSAFGTGPPPAGFVNEAAGVLIERGEALESVLLRRFKQYKKPATVPEPRPLPAPAPEAASRPRPAFPRLARLFQIPRWAAMPAPLAA